MQRASYPRSHAKKKFRGFLVLFAGLVVLTLGIYGISTLVAPSSEAKVTATKLPCPAGNGVEPFGNYVLYYDGLNLHCINTTGSVRWSFQIGDNGGYHCSDNHIAAWSGSNLFVLDENGESTYNDMLDSEIQFARIGKSYVAVVTGSSTEPELLIMDLTGTEMDKEIDAYSSLIILDIGFFGSTGQYMWTLSLDVYGTAANTTLNTFEVGKMNTGACTLGEYITYKVLYDNGLLRVISSRKIRTFSERGTEDTSASILAYGWTFLDSESPSRGNSYMLFAPSDQTKSTYSIQELRLIQGTTLDKRYSLSDKCLGALVYNKAVYAISATQVYRAGQNEGRFTVWDIPLKTSVTDYYGKLDNGYAIVASGDSVYCLKLPQGN